MGKPEIRFKGYTDEWEQRKLDDVVEFLDTMRKPLEGAKRIPGPYPYYGASGIVDYVDGYLFDEELILLSEDGANITERNYPVCFLASGKYWVNNHAHVLRTKQANENNFICNSLERKDYTQYNTGMAMPKLNKETCKKIPILCPGFEEQKKVGDYFRSLDHLITLHQRKCDEVKSLKKYMLQKMFPQNEQKVPEIRFEGFTEAWEQRKLEDLTEELSDYATMASGLPLLTSSRSGLMYQSDFRDRKTTTSDETLFSIVPKGSCTYRHMSDDDIFHLNINVLEKGLVSREYPVFISSENNDLEFIIQHINSSNRFRTFCKGQKKGGTRTRLYYKTLCEFEMMIPSIEEQKKISATLHNLDHLITLHQRKPILHPNHPTIYTKHKGEEKYVRIRVNDREKTNRTANLRRFPVDIPGGFKN